MAFVDYCSVRSEYEDHTALSRILTSALILDTGDNLE